MMKKLVISPKEQIVIDMHPLEEAEIQATWNRDEILQKLPAFYTKNEEMEWLVEFGADYVKKKRAELFDAIEASRPDLDAANKKINDAHDTWCKHVSFCLENGLDKDTHDKEKYNAS